MLAMLFIAAVSAYSVSALFDNEMVAVALVIGTIISIPAMLTLFVLDDWGTKLNNEGPRGFVEFYLFCVIVIPLFIAVGIKAFQRVYPGFFITCVCAIAAAGAVLMYAIELLLAPVEAGMRQFGPTSDEGYYPQLVPWLLLASCILGPLMIYLVIRAIKESKEPALNRPHPQ